MSDKSSPRSSDECTASRQTRNPGSLRAQYLLWFAVIATLALLTANVWMLSCSLQSQHAGSREHAFWVLCQPGASTSEREQAFRRLVVEGNKEWRSADLRELNLSRVSLPGADLRGGNFMRSVFAGANLSRAQFCNGSWDQADLSNANLQEADLSETLLLRANLKSANLRRAKLRAASIEQAQAENVDLMLADISDANCLMANLTGAKLDGANLSGARLESAVLNKAALSLTRLDGADLKHAEFKNANWWRARGLRTDQIELLKQEFPPTDDADSALKQDYAKWLAEAR